MEADVSEKRVSDYLDSRAPVLSPRTRIQDALRLVRGHGYSALPVCEGERFLGLVREKDLLKMTPSQATLLSRHEIAGLLDRVTVGAVVTAPPVTISDDLTVREASEIMRIHSSAVLPVLRNGRYAGLISWEEILDAVMGDSPLRRDMNGGSG
ncbi:MAG: CBS domain-containing protein [Deltaproteobacteria bacterium]|nr:CBS domain-containing protein [Deltaproteobacteria bacterium]